MSSVSFFLKFSACPNFRSKFDLEPEVNDDTVTDSSNRILTSRHLTNICQYMCFGILPHFRVERSKPICKLTCLRAISYAISEHRAF